MPLETCQACGSGELDIFYETPPVPSSSCVLLNSYDEAVSFPTGVVRLGFCRRCGFIQNSAFDQSLVDYTLPYEETQGFSQVFQGFARDLARELIDRYDLRHKDLLEIGCGKGEFLASLCEMGPNRGIGIDPSYVPDRSIGGGGDSVTFIREFFGEEHVHLAGDFVFHRHTLEHISPVARFMDLTRRVAENRKGTPVFVEVPDTRRVLTECAFWDIYYEHCSYFTLGSLGRLLRSADFDVVDLGLGYNDQYLLAHARSGRGSPVLPIEDDLIDVSTQVDLFRETWPQVAERWRRRVEDDADGRVVAWGAGSKAVAFLTTLGLEAQIPFAVDINPHKHGTFLPGSGTEVVPPSFLQDYQPGLVIAMNPIYEQEIAAELARLDVPAQLVVV